MYATFNSNSFEILSNATGLYKDLIKICWVSRTVPNGLIAHIF